MRSRLTSSLCFMTVGTLELRLLQFEIFKMPNFEAIFPVVAAVEKNETDDSFLSCFIKKLPFD